MKRLTRRNFLKTAGWLAASGATFNSLSAAAPAKKRKMTINLVCGALGVPARDQAEVIELAHRHGFESVEARGDELARLAAAPIQELRARMKTAGIVWGAAGLPVDFRGEEGKFAAGLKEFPNIASGLQRAGVTRVGTWLAPSHDSLTYRQNFRQHAIRLREVAKVLKDQGLRFGLEYVGTQNSRNSRKFPFVHTMAETQELIAEIGTGNVGLVLDTWHWWTAGESVEDLRKLTNDQIVAVDLNDAPAGIPRDQQIDNRRELPLATGVIDAGAFLNALNQLGCDAPVRAEPFNAALRKLPKEEALAATAAAMKKAFALIR